MNSNVCFPCRAVVAIERAYKHAIYVPLYSCSEFVFEFVFWEEGGRVYSGIFDLKFFGDFLGFFWGVFFFSTTSPTYDKLLL